MFKYICVTPCYGFRGRYWKEGEAVEISEQEQESIPEHFRFVRDMSKDVEGTRVEDLDPDDLKELETKLEIKLRQKIEAEIRPQLEREISFKLQKENESETKKKYQRRRISEK